jgi:hypothetical protein
MMATLIKSCKKVDKYNQNVRISVSFKIISLNVLYCSVRREHSRTEDPRAVTE